MSNEKAHCIVACMFQGHFISVLKIPASMVERPGQAPARGPADGGQPDSPFGKLRLLPIASAPGGNPSVYHACVTML